MVRSKLRGRFRKGASKGTTESLRRSAADRRNEDLKEILPDDVILFCQGRKYAFQRNDPTTGNLVFWPWEEHVGPHIERPMGEVLNAHAECRTLVRSGRQHHRRSVPSRTLPRRSRTCLTGA
jgi:hypothetical protein